MTDKELKLWVKYKKEVSARNAKKWKEIETLNKERWDEYIEDKKQYEKERDRTDAYHKKEQEDYDKRSRLYKLFNGRPESKRFMRRHFGPVIPFTIWPYIEPITQEGFMTWMAKRRKLLK